MTNETFTIQVEGLDDIIHKMSAFPRTLDKELRDTMKASLYTMEGAVPDYPRQKNPDTKYVRTNTLDHSLTVGGPMNIAKTEKLGGMQQARFGTNLEYAPYVISDTMQAEQHRGWWWTVNTIIEKAIPKLNQLFNAMKERLVAFLNREGRV